MKISKIFWICALSVGFGFASYAEVAPTTVSLNRSATGGRTTRSATNRVRSTGSTGTRKVSSNRAVSSRAATNNKTSRSVSSRAAVNSSNGVRQTRTTSNRITKSRVAMVAAGTSSRGSSYARAAANVSLGDLINSSTGYINDSVYDSCQEAYEECMTDVCTRTAEKGICACSDKIQSYDTIDKQIEDATLQLLEISNELTLLIATGGDASLMASAMTQSDAEQILSCISNSNSCNGTCGNTGISCNDLANGDSSILAELSNIGKLVESNSNSENEYVWRSVLDNWESLLNNLSTTSNTATNTADNYMNETSSADLWGTNLLKFADPEYKSNNSPYTGKKAAVCARVLDNCFNGIANSLKDAYESGQYSESQYNTYSQNDSDPYKKYRSLILNARRAIRDRFALKVENSCTEYNEKLKKKVQNMKVQLASAKALLQQKRIEFKKTSNADTATRLSNWNNCYNEALVYMEDYGYSYTSAGFASAMANSSYCSASMPLDNSGKEVTNIANRLFYRYRCENQSGSYEYDYKTNGCKETGLGTNSVFDICTNREVDMYDSPNLQPELPGCKAPENYYWVQVWDNANQNWGDFRLMSDVTYNNYLGRVQTVDE